MKRTRLGSGFSCFVLLCVLGWTSPGSAQPRFTLDVTGPSSVGGPEGTTVRFGARCRLWTEGVENGDDGAQGWSIGVETVGPCAITVATTVATAGATVKNGGFRDAGFERTEKGRAG